MRVVRSIAVTIAFATLAGCSTVADTPLLLAGDLDFPLTDGHYVFYQMNREADCRPINGLPIMRPEPASERGEIFCPSATTVLTRTDTGYTLLNEQQEGAQATIAFSISSKLGSVQVAEIHSDGKALYVVGGPAWIGDGSVTLAPRSGAAEVWGISNLDCDAWSVDRQMQVTSDGSCKLASRDELVTEIARATDAGLAFTHERLKGPFVVLVPID